MILWYQVIVLALIQGITEFLPVSSSAHLILPSQLLGWSDQGLTFDVAVHAGTLLAVIAYFRREIVNLLHSVNLWMPGKFQDANKDAQQYSLLAGSLLVATLPAGIFGLWLNDQELLTTRSIWVIATTTLIFGLLLAFADRYVERLPMVRHKSLHNMNLKHALLIGCAQVFALIPGTSRSGVTLTAALLLNFNRQAAARFSFLLAIPLIAAAGSLKTWEWLQHPSAVDWRMLVSGFFISAVSAFLCIKGFLAFIDRVGLMPFVIYRILLSIVLFGIASSGILSE